MTLPYSFSRLKCKLALDMYLPKLVERKLHESGGVTVNLVQGNLKAHETAEVRDCSIQGELVVGAGSKVVGCRIEPGAQLNVGDNCTVVDVYVRDHVAIGDGGTVCSCVFNSSVHMGRDARVFWLTSTAANKSSQACVDFGDSLQAVYSEVCPSVNVLGISANATARSNKYTITVGDDATLLCNGLNVQHTVSKVIAGNGLVVASPWNLDKVDREMELTSSTPSTVVAGIPSFSLDGVTIAGTGTVTIGDDVRLELPLYLSVKVAAKFGDHSKIQTVNHDNSRRTPELYLDKLYMESHSSLLLYGCTAPGATKKALMQLGRGSTLCWLDTPKLSGMLRITAPAGAYTVM